MMRTTISLCLIFICHIAFSQGRYTADLELSFKSGTYILKHAEYYDYIKNEDNTKANKAGLVAKSFLTNTFAEYQALFLAGECHVSEETYYSWKEGIGVNKPIILATFDLEQGDQKYSITKYMLRYGNKEYLAAQLHKNVKGKWYFPGFDENIDRIDLIDFFTRVQQSFFATYKQNRSTLLSNTNIFTGTKQIKGEQLALAYDDKYKPTAPLHEATNIVFEDRIRPVDPSGRQSDGALAEYFRKSAVAAQELQYLLRLLDASLTGQAVSHFSKLTGISLTQLLHECPNALTQ